MKNARAISSYYYHMVLSAKTIIANNDANLYQYIAYIIKREIHKFTSFFLSFQTNSFLELSRYFTRYLHGNAYYVSNVFIRL